MQIRKTHLAALISLIGLGLSLHDVAYAQDDGAASFAPAANREFRDAAIRKALGLSAAAGRPLNIPTRSSAAPKPRTPKSAKPTRVPRVVVDLPWDAAALGLGLPLAKSVARVDERRAAPPDDAAAAEIQRIRVILGLGQEPVVAPMVARFEETSRRMSASRPIDERDIKPNTAKRARAGTRTSESGIERRQESTDAALTAPLAVGESTDDAARPHAMRTPVPKRSRRDPSSPVIADGSAASPRRGNLPVAASLMLPPEEMETLDRVLRVRLRGQFRLDEAASTADATTGAIAVVDDPLLALLHALSTRDAETGRPAPIIYVAPSQEDPKRTAIAAEVFRQIVDRIDRRSNVAIEFAVGAPSVIVEGSVDGDDVAGTAFPPFVADVAPGSSSPVGIRGSEKAGKSTTLVAPSRPTKVAESRTARAGLEGAAGTAPTVVQRHGSARQEALQSSDQSNRIGRTSLASARSPTDPQVAKIGTTRKTDSPAQKILPVNPFSWDDDRPVDLSVETSDHPLLTWPAKRTEDARSAIASPADKDDSSEHRVRASSIQMGNSPDTIVLPSLFVDIFDPRADLLTGRRASRIDIFNPTVDLPRRDAVLRFDIFDPTIDLPRGDQTTVSRSSTGGVRKERIASTRVARARLRAAAALNPATTASASVASMNLSRVEPGQDTISVAMTKIKQSVALNAIPRQMFLPRIEGFDVPVPAPLEAMAMIRLPDDAIALDETRAMASIVSLEGRAQLDPRADRDTRDAPSQESIVATMARLTPIQKLQPVLSAYLSHLEMQTGPTVAPLPSLASLDAMATPATTPEIAPRAERRTETSATVLTDHIAAIDPARDSIFAAMTRMTTTTASDALPRQMLLPRTSSDLPALTRLAAMTLPQLPAAVIALRDPPRMAPTIRYDDVEYPADVIAGRRTSDAESYDTIFVAMSHLAPIEILATTRTTMLLPASLLALQRETAALKDQTDRVVTVQEASRDIVPTAVLAVESPVTFEADEERLNPLQGHRVVIADSRLEELRGGFETDSGLKISFGIERAVYINGNLVTSTSLNVADLSRLTAGQAVSASLDRASLGIIQSGPNNAIGSNQFNSSSMATVIQNTLNGQKIQGITQINATVNSLDLLRKSSLQQSIQSALTDSIRH